MGEQADIADYGRVTESGGMMRRADTIEKRWLDRARAARAGAAPPEPVEA